MNNKLFYQDTFPTKGGGVRGTAGSLEKGSSKGKEGVVGETMGFPTRVVMALNII